MRLTIAQWMMLFPPIAVVALFIRWMYVLFPDYFAGLAHTPYPLPPTASSSAFVFGWATKSGLIIFASILLLIYMCGQYIHFWISLGEKNDTTVQ